MRPTKLRRPQRYWPGKAPAEALKSSSSDEELEEIPKNESQNQDVTSDKDYSDTDSSKDEKETVTNKETNLSDDELDERRAQLRERLLAKKISDQEESETEELLSQNTELSSEDESDSYKPPVLTRPFFKPKKSRTSEYNEDLIKAKENKEREEHELKERREQSKAIISQELERERIQAEFEKAQDFKNVSDTDYPNDELEYSKWKIRELARLKRREETLTSSLEQRESINTCRNLSNEEIEAQKAKEGRLLNQKNKSKLKFLQKYYHKGAFFVDEGRTAELLASKDFSAPTLEDKFDKTLVPKVMQVKNFGRSGRVKYTHLTDQDTTLNIKNWSAPLKKPDLAFKRPYVPNEDFSKPTYKKKKPH